MCCSNIWRHRRGCSGKINPWKHLNTLRHGTAVNALQICHHLHAGDVPKLALSHIGCWLGPSSKNLKLQCMTHTMIITPHRWLWKCMTKQRPYVIALGLKNIALIYGGSRKGWTSMWLRHVVAQVHTSSSSCQAEVVLSGSWCCRSSRAGFQELEHNLRQADGHVLQPQSSSSLENCRDTHFNIHLLLEIMVAKSLLIRKDNPSYPKCLFPPGCWYDMLKVIFQVALTLPLSSFCERSFRALHRLHTRLRSTKGQEELIDSNVHWKGDTGWCGPRKGQW